VCINVKQNITDNNHIWGLTLQLSRKIALFMYFETKLGRTDMSGVINFKLLQNRKNRNRYT
jgi:hypothetical protein